MELLHHMYYVDLKNSINMVIYQFSAIKPIDLGE